MMGSQEDPKDGGAVAGAVFGAVFIYIVSSDRKRGLEGVAGREGVLEGMC
jgi:hypothetical protein